MPPHRPALKNKLLHRLRVEKEAWTKKQLADKARVSQQTILKAERGESISEVSQARIAKALGISVRKLFPRRGK